MGSREIISELSINILSCSYVKSSVFTKPLCFITHHKCYSRRYRHIYEFMTGTQNYRNISVYTKFTAACRELELAGPVVPAQGDLAVGALVLHLLQAIQAEGHTEARPQHGEAQHQAQTPGHQAGLAAGAGRDLHLTAGALQPGWVGA